MVHLRVLQDVSYGDARKQMTELVTRRIELNPPNADVNLVRFPVGLFFARGDRNGEGEEIADQIRASHKYWDLDFGDDLDLILAGWEKADDELVFKVDKFYVYRLEVESESTWEYTGETDLLLLNFDFDLIERSGHFAYDEVIFLPVEAMIRKGIVSSLDALMSQLAKVAKLTGVRSQKSMIWEISDRIGWLRGRKKFWESLKKMVLRTFADVYDELRPFIVVDMGRSRSLK